MATQNSNLLDLSQFSIKGVPCSMIYVQGGTFQMGSKKFDRERPIHPVTLSSFYIGQFPITQALYTAINNVNPSYHKDKSRPVEQVSWEESKEFIDLLNKLPAIQSLRGIFRLPTEAEWEYAARGGIHNQGYKYCGSDDLKQVGWFRENSGMETKPVGLLQPNELGIYDMSGNVYEWCEDDWHKTYENAPDDDRAWVGTSNGGGYRVVRGGRYFLKTVNCRPASRSYSSPGYRGEYIGFRLVFSPQLQESPSDRP